MLKALMKKVGNREYQMSYCSRVMGTRNKNPKEILEMKTQ